MDERGFRSLFVRVTVNRGITSIYGLHGKKKSHSTESVKNKWENESTEHREDV